MDKKELKKIQEVAKIASKKTALYILKCFHIASCEDNNSIGFIATNLEESRSCWIKSIKFENKINVCIPVIPLIDLLAEMLDEDVRFIQNKDYELIVQGSNNNTFILKGIDTQEFPPTSNETNKEIK